MGLNNTVYPYWLAQENNTTTRWSIADNKTFETCLGKYDKDPNKWVLAAAMIRGKTVVDVADHYGKLVEDINQIEGGAFDAELRRFDNVHEYALSSPATFQEVGNRLSDDACREKPASVGNSSGQETKKKGGIHWTEDEHMRFVIGLQNHGNKWTLISREYVVTKSPQQVASHAQKYFARQETKTTGKNESRKRRRSIHDITIETVPSNMMKESHHMPAPTPHRNQTIGGGIPQVPQAGWINHHNGNSSQNLNSVESPDSTFHVAPIGFNPNGHNMSDTSCYESHILAPQQKSAADMSRHELEYWVDHYTEQPWMGFNSNADITLDPFPFGFLTDDPVDLPPFP